VQAKKRLWRRLPACGGSLSRIPSSAELAVTRRLKLISQLGGTADAKEEEETVT
jgi:hypothetical protein